MQMWLRRAIIFVQLDRDEEAQEDLDTMLLPGSVPAVLRLQIFLRRTGSPMLCLMESAASGFEQR